MARADSKAQMGEVDLTGPEILYLFQGREQKVSITTATTYDRNTNISQLDYCNYHSQSLFTHSYPAANHFPHSSGKLYFQTIKLIT